MSRIALKPKPKPKKKKVRKGTKANLPIINEEAEIFPDAPEEVSDVNEEKKASNEIPRPDYTGMTNNEAMAAETKYIELKTGQAPMDPQFYENIRNGTLVSRTPEDNKIVDEYIERRERERAEEK